MTKQIKKEKMKKILKTLPEIRRRIKYADKSIWADVRTGLYGKNDTWRQIEDLCKPLGLTDTAFRENPSLKDYLVSYKYWKQKLNNL